MATIRNDEELPTTATRVATATGAIPSLFIEASHICRGVRVAVCGEVDLATAPQLEAALDAAIADAHTFVEVDLADVTFLDSQGLAVLIRAKTSAGPARQLKIVSASARARRVIDATGMWHHLADRAAPETGASRDDRDSLRLQRALDEARDVYEYALERNRAASSSGRPRPFGAGALQVMARRLESAERAFANGNA